MNESENMDESIESFQENDPASLSEPPSEHLSNDPIENQGDPSDKKEGVEIHTPQFEAFLKEYEQKTNVDQKLQLAIDFMEESIAQGGSPHFKSFWEARRLSLTLFKENITPQLRAGLWKRYSDLSKEARRLKELLDEQSAFAVEQIEMAVQALEHDISQFESHVEKVSLPNDVPFPHSLKKNLEIYQDLQKKLNVLNVQASRINGLRKELIKTDMRVRQKNKFFQRLSVAGDAVFPIRKELIKQVSQLFMDDVNQFVKDYFEQSDSYESLYVLREEIKALQGLAKVLTLNTQAFTQTRGHLSECWDKIKVEEKERKKERASKKVLFKQNAEQIRQLIEEAKKYVQSEDYSPDQAQKNLSEIYSSMRETELSREELRVLKDEVAEIRKTIGNQAKAAENAKYEIEQERSRQKKEKVYQLRDLCQKLVNNSASYTLEQLIQERDQLVLNIQEAPLSKGEKLEIERLLKPLKDIITEKNEQALMDLSEDDKQALQQLNTILAQRKTRRQEIKNQLEILRKKAGSSSLDFEKAMSTNAQISEEKERLEKANSGILEIEEKINALQSKLKTR